jgi:hypothetical protein
MINITIIHLTLTSVSFDHYHSFNLDHHHSFDFDHSLKMEIIKEYVPKQFQTQPLKYFN